MFSRCKDQFSIMFPSSGLRERPLLRLCIRSAAIHCSKGGSFPTTPRWKPVCSIHCNSNHALPCLLFYLASTLHAVLLDVQQYNSHVKVALAHVWTPPQHRHHVQTSRVHPPWTGWGRGSGPPSQVIAGIVGGISNEGVHLPCKRGVATIPRHPHQQGCGFHHTV